ncbi:MAG: hypothetical protein ACREAL_01695 [Nitrosopumilaceae archaeon]
MNTITLVALVILPFFSFGEVFGYTPLLADHASLNVIQYQMMGSMMQSNMMCSMMSQIPEDVIVKVTSPQVVGIDKNAHITIMVFDKKTAEPLVNSLIIVGIERGAPMTTMDMIGPMFLAEEKDDSKYKINFRLDEKGYYTVHTHVIPEGKSMHSMMENHLDIGLIAK